MASKAPDCPINCTSTLRSLRFSVEKEARPFCLICRQTADDLRDDGISLDAHELTYERVDYWLSSDISPLCRKCHDLVEAYKPKPKSHCDTFAITAILVDTCHQFCRYFIDGLMSGRITKDKWEEFSEGRSLIDKWYDYAYWQLQEIKRDRVQPLEIDGNQLYKRFDTYQSGFDWLESEFGEESKEYLAAQRPPCPPSAS